MQSSLQLTGWKGRERVPLPSFQLPFSPTSYLCLYLTCLRLGCRTVNYWPKKTQSAWGQVWEFLWGRDVSRPGPQVTAGCFPTMRAQVPKPESCKERTNKPLVINFSSFLTSFPVLSSQTQWTQGGAYLILILNFRSLLLLEGLSSKDLRWRKDNLLGTLESC